MKYFIVTYGCQMNWADSEKIAAVLEDTEYKPASKIEDADLIVVNMCSVRQSAVDRVMGLKEKIKNKKTIITGCVLKKDWLKLEKQFGKIIDIKEFIKKAKGNYFKKITSYVPIMTGCNNFCAYCVVPYTRGREISRSVKEIICEIKNLVKNGAKKIWLLGQNVNSYKHNTPPPSSPSKREISLTPPPPRRGRRGEGVDFPELLKIVNDIPGGFWIRFTSPHPKDFSDELINTMAKCEKLGEYLNLPVQAGDNQILKKMNRGYTVSQYEKLVKEIRAKIPNIALSTDVIVGFPGERKKQFENTAKLFRKIKYDMAYINKYSPRAGTVAAKMKDNVSPKEKIRRAKILNEIIMQTALENNKKCIGKTFEVLITAPNIGKTRSNKTIKINNDIPVGKFVNVKITDALVWGLKGELKNEQQTYSNSGADGFGENGFVNKTRQKI
ncbi:MAG: hypothetical protein A2W55_00675 [Candidatus Nealsonbacteria bacterium RIFCSPHIGHO2_02_38_10]|nr:MAG: hypothetical protein A2W55_00675 [Candidatus Nealsonbacteria bacterium RIFCSPHIGHO2_02_38_10]